LRETSETEFYFLPDIPFTKGCWILKRCESAEYTQLRQVKNRVSANVFSEKLVIIAQLLPERGHFAVTIAQFLREDLFLYQQPEKIIRN